jgi:hypothetical protein
MKLIPAQPLIRRTSALLLYHSPLAIRQLLESVAGDYRQQVGEGLQHPLQIERAGDAEAVLKIKRRIMLSMIGL